MNVPRNPRFCICVGFFDNQSLIDSYRVAGVLTRSSAAGACSRVRSRQRRDARLSARIAPPEREADVRCARDGR